MFYLAICYEKGEGTDRNSEKAFYWYYKAAENGNEKAMFNLAIYYNNEEGIEKNFIGIKKQRKIVIKKQCLI
jgi:TPR repeat protein